MLRRIALLAWLAVVANGVGAEPVLDHGRKIFQETCSACHTPGNIMVASPKAWNVADWTPRLAVGGRRLVDNAVSGINAMPAKGNCASCSEADIAAAVSYMLPKALRATLFQNPEQ